jgi:uncharacterized protein (DUF2062 family)
MIRSITRLPRYYILRVKRLRGTPEYLARGIGLGVFMGVLPLVPIQTLILVPLSAALQVSTVAALIASVMVSNPLTFLPQYYLTWKLGNFILPGRISWEHLQEILVTIQQESFGDSIVTFSHLGMKTITVLLTGGTIIGLPLGVISYFISLHLFRAIRKKRREKHELT